jgi:hypothetical protein
LPSREDHLKQARHNSEFYDSIDKSLFPDWAVTVLFYTALHYIDSFLAQIKPPPGIHPLKHQVRDNAVALVAELKPIFANYSFLKNQSFNARYKVLPFNAARVTECETKHLHVILAQIRRHMTM